MDFYLIEYLCKEGKNVWAGKVVVKAKNAVHAWDRFKSQWQKDLKKGETDVSPSVIIKYSVERICSKREALV
ncbi:MAG: hypothetical protein H5U02_00025 [Clostridia bacterium]|nr:hypothetical protein [Clostridia bacterium]